MSVYVWQMPERRTAGITPYVRSGGDSRWLDLLERHDALVAADVARHRGRLILHTGEVELRGGDVAGVAVHVGARVAGLAGAGEVLVSTTVKDLVLGSGLEFADRGEHELKGVPGRWQVFAAAGT